MENPIELKAMQLLERIAENYPARDDVRFYTPSTDTVTAGTSLTVTFTLRRDFEIHVTKLYCDARASCTYTWIFAGISYSINEVDFDWGKRTRVDEDEITLVVANAGGTDVDVGYYIRGWARRKAVN